jgi:hypothetical protein
MCTLCFIVHNFKFYFWKRIDSIEEETNAASFVPEVGNHNLKKKKKKKEKERNNI